MNFSKVTPDELYVCLKTVVNYNKYIEDTEETIDKLDIDLRQQQLTGFQDVYNWFANELLMRKSAKTLSLYRAFLCLRNDEIFNLRISNHYSTKEGIQRIWDRFYQPDSEYHLILEKIQVPLAGTPISNDTVIYNTPIIVKDYSISDFIDPNKRNQYIDEIIDILENGTDGDSKTQNTLNESKTNKYIMKQNQKKALYESIMRRVSKTVQHMLNEEVSEISENPLRQKALMNLEDFFYFLLKLNNRRDNRYKLSMTDLDFRRLREHDFDAWMEIANNTSTDARIEFTPTNVRYDADCYCQDYNWRCIKCDIANEITNAQSGNEDWADFRIPFIAFANEYEHIKDVITEMTAKGYEPVTM